MTTAPAPDFPARRARMWLLAQLREEHFSTRLGAVYGLAYHLDHPEVVESLRQAEALDVNEDVRMAVAIVLTHGQEP